MRENVYYSIQDKQPVTEHNLHHYETLQGKGAVTPKQSGGVRQTGRVKLI